MCGSVCVCVCTIHDVDRSTGHVVTLWLLTTMLINFSTNTVCWMYMLCTCWRVLIEALSVQCGEACLAALAELISPEGKIV